jgi:ABC-type bacteriocin/lantibiotic exporter with double-glycine peptidase domain
MDNVEMQTLPRLMRRLWHHINFRRRLQLGLLFMVMVAASFAEIVSIGAVLPFLGALTAPEQIFMHPMARPLIDFLNLTEPKQLLLPLSIAFGIAALFSGFMRLVLLWSQTRLSYAIGADFSYSIYRRTLYQPFDVHLSRNSSEVIAGISGKANTVVGSALLPIASISSAIIMLSFILLALLTIDSTVAISAFIGFGVIYAVVILSTKKSVTRDSKRINYETGRVIKALQEGLGGIRDVIIDGSQAKYSETFRKADLPLRRAQSNIAIIANSPRYVIEALGMVLIAFLAYSLSDRTGGITNAIPVLGALALAAQRLLPVLQQSYSNWTLIRGAQAPVSAALDLLDQTLPEYLDRPPQTPIPFNSSITLTNLAFKFSTNTPFVLKEGFNLSINKGSRIGIVGSTGSGKSTLLDIIMGLLEPNNGCLAIDGLEINDGNRRGWQAHIAHVPQTIFLADSTIAENIAFCVPESEIDFNRVQQAAQKAQIAQTIESWSKGYDTPVGERGARLSGGQRQRIGIARALYKQADVIVFDEATSALDNDTESSVMESIEGLDDGLTLIIVAHRLSTLKNCSLIVELEDGSIRQSGTYN